MLWEIHRPTMQFETRTQAAKREHTLWPGAQKPKGKRHTKRMRVEPGGQTVGGVDRKEQN